jgi:hypothetical protein
VLPVVGEPVEGEKEEDPPVEPVEYLGATRDAGMRSRDGPSVLVLREEGRKEEEPEREAMIQLGKGGAPLGLGGIVFCVELEEAETPGGNFTLGKVDAGFLLCGILLDCSRVRVKS